MREDIRLNDCARALSAELIAVLETVFDSEIELDIYNLGLVYEITVDEAEHCRLVMTFTDTGCSCSETMPVELVEKLTKIEGIRSANIEIVWSPAWKMTRISRLGRITLGISPR
ncbi:metal-sulfur cluster assembly factor [Streptococcus gallolyticus]|nr:metal-sulfur cluster assembly factor [Streptococcus gallolyticus]MBY5042179.1 metal-sulfur cluster assembly factor [Streptococcus gallolyticus]